MFDIGFSELLIVGIVALIVIGPDKLPAVARTAGVIFGRMQRLTSNLKSEINKELQIEDLKQLKSELKDHALGLKEELRQGMQPVEEVIQQSKLSLTSPVQAETALAQPVSELKTEPELTKQAEDLKRLKNELRDHELGLKEELRQGMQPVEEVIQQSKLSLTSSVQAETALAQPVSELKTEPELTKQAEDLKRLKNELRDHELGLKEELRQGMQPVEEVIQQNKASGRQEITLPPSASKLNEVQYIEPEFMKTGSSH